MLLCALACCMAVSAEPLEPIRSATIGANRSFQVNERPFFPIMIWLQDPGNFPRAEEAGISTVAGYWPQSGGTKDVAEYLELVKNAGLYGVMPYDERLRGNPALLGYIHDDEPDLSHLESNAEVVGGEGLRINTKTPLWKIVDGVTHSWSVLDPLEGAGVTVKLAEPVTVARFGIWLTISPGLSVAKEVVLSGDGKELVRAPVKAERGRQEIALAQPATFQELTLQVTAAEAGEQVWGSLGELEGFDAAGENVLLSPPWKVPRQTPEQTLATYREIKAADATRPVFMTVTGRFLPSADHWPAEQRETLYPAYAQATDVLGFDIYPIYGWGRPDWLDRVHDGTAGLREIAGERPVYAWIETSAGSQWVSEANQKPVRPEHIRAEVWMALCRGATAIGYFTHIWKPSYSQFGVPPENVSALRQINDQITKLTPALLAAPARPGVEISIAGDLKADILAKNLDGTLYLFAVNYDPAAKAGKATITVPGLPAGSRVEVVDEGRALTAQEGVFRDDFGPLAVHIYRLAEPDSR